MVSACSDGITESKLADEGRTASTSLAAAEAVDTVSYHWATETQDASGVRRVKEVSSRQILGAVALRHGTKPQTAVQPKVQDRSGDGSGVFSIEDLPLPIVSFRPVVNRNALGSVKWEKTQRDPNDIAILVVVRGVGSSPPHEMLKYRNGLLELSVRSVWRLGPVSWDLEKQVTTTGDGKFRSTLTVSHSGQSRPQIEVPSRVQRQRLALRTTAAAETPSQSDRLGPIELAGRTSSVNLMNDPFQDCVDRKCATLGQDALTALGYANIANAAMAVACVIPTPINVLACALATTAAAWTTQDFLNKNAAYGRCMAQAREQCRKCNDELEVAPVDYLGRGVIQSLGSRLDSLASRRTLDLFRSRDECIVEWEFTDNAGPYGGGTSSGNYETCYWLITWDAFGTILDVVLLGCEEYQT
jgi:hypothetical protein